MNANTIITTAINTPVSPTMYLVIPVSLVSGSKRFCTNRLELACNRTTGHMLPDLSLNHAKIKLIAITVMVNIVAKIEIDISISHYNNNRDS